MFGRKLLHQGRRAFEEEEAGSSEILTLIYQVI
jgi:hypothetical protein